MLSFRLLMYARELIIQVPTGVLETNVTVFQNSEGYTQPKGYR